MESDGGKTGGATSQRTSAGRAFAASLKRQLVEQKWVLALAVSTFAIVFGTLILVRISTGIAIAEFTRDPLGFTGLPVYKGAVSNLGVVIWAGGAAICFFSYGLVRLQSGGRRPRLFLLFAGIISLALVLDDLYMLHEVVFPDHVGIPENVVYGTYGVAVFGLLAGYRKKILQSDYLLLILALAGFAVSILSDAIAAYVTIPAFYVFEDGGKFFGILCWTAYFTRVSAQDIHTHIVATVHTQERRNGMSLARTATDSGTETDGAHTLWSDRDK